MTIGLQEYRTRKSRWIILTRAVEETGLSWYMLRKTIREHGLQVRSNIDPRKKFIDIDVLKGLLVLREPE